MTSWFRKLGIQVRQKATTAKWLFYEFTGTEEDSFRVEREAGRALADLLVHKYPPDEDPSVRKFIADMGGYLAHHVSATKYQLSFVPVSSHVVNAFALPGGTVFITRGLMEFAEWERDEIAFALAHEIGHIVRRHARDKLVANAAKKGLALLAPRTRIQHSISSLCDAYVNSEYSKDCEFEADSFAADLLISGNMDPLSGCAFLGRLDDTSTAAFFRSHPPVNDRIKNIKAISDSRKAKPT